MPLVVVSDFSEGVQRDLQAQLAPSMLGEDAAMLVYGEKSCGEGCVRPSAEAGQLARSVRAAHAAAVADCTAVIDELCVLRPIDITSVPLLVRWFFLICV